MENKHDKVVLACRNPECGRDSCRLCKEPSHIPLRCEENENSDEEIWRKKIKEGLSMALIRECYDCEQSFMKEEGCNMMTLWSKDVLSLQAPSQGLFPLHSQGWSPSATKTCPLWSDMASLFAWELAKAAMKAKEELAADQMSFKWDPTLGIPETVAGTPPPASPPAVPRQLPAPR